MRTTVNIPDSVLKDTQGFSQGKSTIQAVNLALTDWIRRRKIDKVRSLRGQIRFNPHSAQLPELSAVH